MRQRGRASLNRGIRLTGATPGVRFGGVFIGILTFGKEHAMRSILRIAFAVALLSLAVSPAWSRSSAPPAGASGPSAAVPKEAKLPQGFVYVADLIPGALLDIRYYGSNNFVGARVDGYFAPRAILSRKAAEALKNVAGELAAQGFALKIFDAYRPQTAVNHFVRWAGDPRDITAKSAFYPEVDKSRLFEEGYIASRSGHSRGSTVDLTIVDVASGKELDMGSPFDFFGPVSHHGAKGISPIQTANRKVLRDVMEKHGFKIYPEEWWHYTLANEPYPDTYFDFPVR